MKLFKRQRQLSLSFVSYPKSGRTWARYALMQMGAPDSIRFHHDGFEFNDGAKPPLDFNPEKRLHDYAKVDRIIYLERDPRDVMCSLFHQITGRFRDFFHYEGTVSDFIRDPYFGAQNLHGFRKMWAEIGERRNVLKVTYEGMTEDPGGTLLTIADYYEFPADQASIERAVEESRFSKMKAVEASGEFEKPWLLPRNGHPKVRSGKVHGYRDQLGDEDIAYLNEVFGLD